MQFLKKIQSFGATTNEMVNLWITYCRSVLEQSAIVWSSSLTAENKADIERTQKSFAKMILKNKYTSYQDSLLKLNLPTLEERRNELSLKFAKKCLHSEKFKDLFPENPPHQINTRNYEKYQIPHCLTERMKHSGLMHMKYQLNTDHNMNRKDQ